MKNRESIGRMLGYLHRQAQRYFYREFSKLGLGSGTHVFLMLLHHHDGVTQQELTEKLHFDKAHTTRAIQKLIELGYVKKEKNPNDLRAYRIHLTKKAQEIVPQVKKVLCSWSDILSKNFSQEEKRSAMELLQKMTENAVEFTKNCD